MNTTFEALSMTCQDGGVCEIVLTRPELLNRFDNLLQVELASALAQVGRDETV
jgi:enoyl-CoA hydratase